MYSNCYTSSAIHGLPECFVVVTTVYLRYKSCVQFEIPFYFFIGTLCFRKRRRRLLYMDCPSDSHKGTPQANARCVGLVGLLRGFYLEREKLEANVPKITSITWQCLEVSSN